MLGLGLIARWKKTPLPPLIRYVFPLIVLFITLHFANQHFVADRNFEFALTILLGLALLAVTASRRIRNRIANASLRYGMGSLGMPVTNEPVEPR